MALFVLGDTHLSLGASKPMDIFACRHSEAMRIHWQR